MKINKTAAGNALTIALEGRLDTNTAPELEAELKLSLNDAASVVFDFKDLAYISSAGLRVLLMAQKIMNAKPGAMVIRNCSADIMDIFDVTGFVDILTIEA